MKRLNLGGGLSAFQGWINVDIARYAALKTLPRPMLRLLYARSAWKHSMDFDTYHRILASGEFIRHNLTRGIPFDDDTIDYIYASHFLDSLTRSDGVRLLEEAARVLRPGGMIRLSVSDLERNIELYLSGDREAALQRLYPQSLSRANLRYWMYDFATLHSALLAAGFADIERRTFQCGAVPDAELLDNRPEESLFVEARKPLRK